MRLASYSPSWNDGSGFVNPNSNNVKARNATPTEMEIQQSVRQVLFPNHAERRLPERRQDQRHPFPHPVRLTPLGTDGKPLVDETVVVIGRNLSLLGFDFYHVQPLPYRRVIASFDLPNGQCLGFLLDLSWCRFGKHGFYDGGGRFLKVTASPLPAEPAA